MNEFIRGFNAFFRGAKFSVTKLSIWFIVPIIIWLVLVIGLAIELSDWLIPLIYEIIESVSGVNLASQNTDSGWIDILKTGFRWGLIIVIKILVWYLLGRYMKYLILIILSPLFAYISEKTEEIITGNKYPFSIFQFMKDVVRGAGIAIRNMILETGIVIIAGIISFVLPVISPLILVLLFLVNSYFMAFNFFDYVAERKRMNIGQSIRYMRENKMTLLGFGVAYNIVSWMPLLDWVLAPISAAAGAVIADMELPKGKNSTSFV
ncbi:MAG: hypothetical protein RLZ10_2216 [Bacteroidota bacterium]|jgi:CysZ protein